MSTLSEQRWLIVFGRSPVSRGHLAADRFGGSPDLDNLVSQSSSVNLSKYKKLENQWAKAIEEGKDVSVNVKINYEGNSLRPSGFDIEYEIDEQMFDED